MKRARQISQASAFLVDKGNHRHFMEKEIHEQPDSVQHTLSEYLDLVTGTAKSQAVDFAAIDRIQIVACGTAFYAGQIARYAFEKLAGLPCDVEIASEFRYRSPAVSPRTLAVAVSQSGETADTLASLTWCKAQGLRTAAVVRKHYPKVPIYARARDGRHARRLLDHGASEVVPETVEAGLQLAARVLEGTGLPLDAVELRVQAERDIRASYSGAT